MHEDRHIKEMQFMGFIRGGTNATIAIATTAAADWNMQKKPNWDSARKNCRYRQIEMVNTDYLPKLIISCVYFRGPSPPV